MNLSLSSILVNHGFIDLIMLVTSGYLSLKLYPTLYLTNINLQKISGKYYESNVKPKDQ